MKYKLHFIRVYVPLLLLVVSTLSWAYDFEVDGICYNKKSWGHTSVIVANKECGKYSGDIIIPSDVTYNKIKYKVTDIDDNAFYYCSELKSVTISSNIISIGKSAFEGCDNLSKVILPNTLRFIRPRAFWGCEKISRINLPSSLTEIRDLAFCSCSNLDSLVIPKSITSINEMAFAYCNSLSYITVENGNNVYDSRDNCNAIIETNSNSIIVGCKNSIIPHGIKKIGNYAFSGLENLTYIAIPNSVDSICQGAFGDTGLKSIILPDNIIYVGSYAFQSCDSTKSVTIPKSVVFVDDCAFSGNSGLESVIILGDGISFGKSVFAECENLSNIYCYAEFPPMCSSDNLFGGCSRNATLHVPQKSKKLYEDSFVWSREFKNIVSLDSDDVQKPMLWIMLIIAFFTIISTVVLKTKNENIVNK